MVIEEKPVNNDTVPDVAAAEVRETAQIKQQMTDLKNSLSKLELQLQASQKELIKNTETLKEKDAELAEIKQTLDNKIKESAHVSEELMKMTSQLDKTVVQLEASGK